MKLTKKKTTNSASAVESLLPCEHRSELIFATGETHYQSLLTDIAHAKTSIDFESYIFSNDEAGQEVAQALIEALDRDVAVRVLVDGVGSPFWSRGLGRRLERAGAKTKIYNPLPWQIWNWQRSTRRHWFFLKWLFLFWNINTRNHRKTVIIDNEIAYIGSFNVHKCHLPKERGGFGWRDTSVRITGADLSALSKAFKRTWDHQPIRERLRDTFKRFKKNPKFRLNTPRHSRRILFKNLLRKLERSQSRVWITSAYFVPNAPLLRRLKEAADRQVDVRLLLPQNSDITFVDWAAMTYYKKLLKSHVRIFEYKPSVLHAKSIIVDDWMVVGSTNLNSRSLIHDLEVDVEIQTEEAKHTLQELYIEDLSHSEEITLNNWQGRLSWGKRIMGHLTLYFRYFI